MNTKEYNKQYYAAHREELAAKHKDWYALHSKEVIAKSAVRKAQKRADIPRIARLCLGCGEPFEVNASNKTKRYCSQGCGQKVRKGRVPVTRACPQCGCDFEVNASNTLKIYCTYDCGAKAWRERKAGPNA